MKIETPRGTLINVNKSGKKIRAKLTWNPQFQKGWETRFNNAQKFVDSECLRHCDKLVPFQTGFLKKSGILGTKIGSGELNYLSPYSRYQYYGKVMVGKPPKRKTNIPLKYQFAPKRGAKWFERMKVEHKDAILRGASRFMKG